MNILFEYKKKKKMKVYKTDDFFNALESFLILFDYIFKF